MHDNDALNQLNFKVDKASSWLSFIWGKEISKSKKGKDMFRFGISLYLKWCQSTQETQNMSKERKGQR